MSSGARLRFPVDESDHSQGPADAPVLLVEYGDYECPYCGAAYAIIRKIQERMGNDLCFVFRNFPIASAHPYAMGAALAAEAAGMQGAFWPMHNLLFENQQRLDPESLIQDAVSLGLDLEKISRDMTGSGAGEKVLRDQYGGMRSGVRGTPGFFINGLRFDEDWSYDSLLAAVLARIRKAG